MKIMMFNHDIYNKFANRKHNFYLAGYNTGNLLFWHALKHILKVESHTVQGCLENRVDLSCYDAIVTTDLIWIQENISFKYIENQLKIAGDRPLVPISVGLQSSNLKSDFKIHPDTLKVLKALQERCILGVRGNYTAEILDKNGINNIQVIGCPSLYYNLKSNFNIITSEYPIKNVTCNFRSFHSKLSQQEINFLKYCATNDYLFCEQTMQPFSLDICTSVKDFNQIYNWLNLNKFIFFDIEDWKKFNKGTNFSIGSRFHGNVISLWNNTPALFIKIDSRTSELTEFFSLPCISLDEFDEAKPIEYYYDKADYSEFNKKFPILCNGLNEFFNKNKLL